jgi:NAD+ synthase (glutamine-hydrolysing)
MPTFKYFTYDILVFTEMNTGNGPSTVTLNRDLGFLRIGGAVPALKVADVDFNVKAIQRMLRRAAREKVQVVVFPEMALTGYTLGDLVQHQALLNKAEEGLKTILEYTRRLSLAAVLGLPVSLEGKVYNCAALVDHGQLRGVVPKTYLPNYKEFYDERWFESGNNCHSSQIELAGQLAPFGSDLLFQIKGFPLATIGIEVCEDLWVPFSPHEYQAVAGASLLINLSASNEVLGKADWRRTLVASESGRCLAGYCYVSCGIGESSNDVIFGGHCIMAENGTIIQESPRLARDEYLAITEFDLERLAFDRRSSSSFQEATRNLKTFRTVDCEVEDIPARDLRRTFDPHPFVPADPLRRAERCGEIFSMQVGALSKKLSGAKIDDIVLGVSGGLDSTLALLVAVKTMDFLGLSRKKVHTYTLPGFGTTERTRSNATRLCEALGVNFEEKNIVRTCTSYLEDLGHASQEDVVFENAQARYRTNFLFNKANQLNALNLGTGDLTEVALGWSTFAGDHISHYHINVSVPKTLVRFLVRWVADEELANSPVQKILVDILDTPISPELLRPRAGKIAQKSEDIIGPVELADFYLYRFIRFGMRPGKILFQANEVRLAHLFDQEYSLEDLDLWLKSFINRFFHNQFKRTCLPEGPKIGSVSLSPRGDWRMPSDAEPALWLEDLEKMYRRLKS